MTLRVRRIEDAAGLRDLGPAWEEMVAHGGQSSPFLSHDWFLCCWPAVMLSRRPEVLLVEESGAPVAIAPMMRWVRRGPGGLPIRCLALLVAPDTPVADVIT